MNQSIKKIIKIILVTLFAAGTLALNIAPSFAALTDLLPTQQGVATEKTSSVLKNLPHGNWTDIIATVIKTMLQIAGALSVAAFTVGGVFMITAQGNPENLKKGQGIILWSLVALVIMAIAYSIVLGVTQLKFFG